LDWQEQDEAIQVFENLFNETRLDFGYGILTFTTTETTISYYFRMEGNIIALTDEDGNIFDEVEMSFQNRKVSITVYDENRGTIFVTFRKI